MKKRNLISILLYVLILALVFSFLMQVQPQNDDLSYSQVVSLLEDGRSRPSWSRGIPLPCSFQSLCRKKRC